MVQASSAAPPSPAAVVAAASPSADVLAPAAPSAACPEGMVEITGSYCDRVEQVCVKWLGKDGQKKDRCAEFAPRSRCVGHEAPKHVCMDRYEYPNRAGEKPAVATTWAEARNTCASQGKRLCGSEEWTLACEGPSRLPYPTGYTRDREACDLDKPYIMPNNREYANPATRAAELARTDQRDASGSHAACASAFGVHDMVGNVDEWVVNEHGSMAKAPYKSGLKGGYWGPVRNRCRPMTTDHNAWHSGYQVGFRCCADPKT